MKIFKHLFTALLLLFCTVVNAHDFEVNGIYYNITDEANKTVKVTYKGSSYSEYSNEYTDSVVIPESVIYNGTTYSVTSIGDFAFYECSGLTSIEIPNSVTSIGGYAFCSCSGLTSVVIPNSVTSIGSSAFYSCSGLTGELVIPNSVTSINNSAFSGCSGLTSIVVAEGNVKYDSRDNCNAIIEKETNTLVVGCKNTIIPNSVTSIGNYAFWNCSGLTSITIPNSVTSIGNHAFRGCSGLTSIEIPNSVTSIGDEAFHNCSRLTSIEIPNSVTSIGNYAFWNCSGLTSVVIPNSVTSIGSSAFYDCYRLTSVVIGNSVTSIGSRAFASCSKLTSVLIGNSVKSIGFDAFYECSGLTSIVIPNSVTSIGNGAFSGCSGLTSITIPNSVTSIGNYAFSGCSGLTSIEIPNSVTSIEHFAFYECSGLTSIVIPNSVTSIGGGAFEGCKNLTSIEIPNSVTSIGGSAFAGCSGLTSIEIPNSVTSIGSSAFEGCSGLKTVINYSSLTIEKGSSGNGYVGYYAAKVINAPNGTIEGDFVFGIINGVNTLVQYLGNDTEIVLPDNYSKGNYAIGEAFRDNTSITSIEIPNSVTSIGNYAFEGCSGLKTVINNSSLTIEKGSSGNGYVGYYADKVINEGDFVFDVIDGVNTLVQYLGNDTEIVLPDNYSKGNYAIGEAFRYNTSITSIEIPNSVTSIGEGAFYECSGLTSIVIPNSVTSIGMMAFSGCSGLTSIVIPNSVTSIGNGAFSGCSGLTSVVIPNSVTSIGSTAFSGCSGLTSIEIPNSVTSIGSTAFSGCSGLTSIEIPNSVTSIGNYAFYNCKKLKTVINYSSLKITKGSKDYGYIAYYADIVVAPVTGISLDKETATIIEGETTTLTATIIPSTATDKIVTWTSDNEEVATVNNSGVVTAVKAGTATITATAGGHSATCVVTVEKKVIAVTGVSLNKSTATITEGGTTTLAATVIPSTATNKTVAWATSDASIATVEGGVVTAVKAGTATITATAGGYSATCVVTVEKKVIAVTGISLDKTTATITEGETTTLVATVAPSTATDQTVTWTTSDASIATVNNGVVTAVKAGTATITATAGGHSATCVVTVEAKEKPEEPAGLIAGRNYRIKHNTTGYYMTVVSTESSNHDAGGVQIKTLDNKELNQVFTLESVAENSFKIKSIKGYYLSSFGSWGYNATVNNSDAAIHQFTEVEKSIYTLEGSLGYIGSNSDNRGGKEHGAWIYSNHGSDAQNIYWVFEPLTAEENKELVALRTAEAMNVLERSIARGKEVVSSRAAVLSDNDKTSINAAVRTAENEKENACGDVDEEIARLTALAEAIDNAVEDAIYIWSIDDISNSVCYTVSTEDKGSWYSEESQLNSTNKLAVSYAISNSKQQFAFVKSAKSGKYYLYSVGEDKFVAINGSHTTLTETPEMGIVFLDGTRSAAYPWVVAFDTAVGEKQISVSNGYDPGVITSWNNLSDSGNTVRFEKAAAFDAAAALSLVEGYESETTGIEQMDGMVKVVYDLSGRRIVDAEYLEHGVYIINGRKVVK